MSSIKPASRPAPATSPTGWQDCDLIVVGHGSESCPAANASLKRQAMEINARGLFRTVRAAALHGQPSPERALRGLAQGKTFIVPLFMCGGTTVRDAVPKAFGLDGPITETGQGKIFMCKPAGLAAGMTDLIDARARKLASVHGLRTNEATLLLISHGSPRDPSSWQATERHAAQLRHREFGSVRTAYLHQAPEIEEILNELTGPVMAVGLFAGRGRHAGLEIPCLLENANENVFDLGPISSGSGLGDLVIEQVAAVQH